MTNEAHDSGEIAEDPTATRTNAEPERLIEAIEDLHALQPGAHIEVTRIAPQDKQCKGYLGHIVVPDDGMGDIKEEIKNTWGGGTYQLRAKDTGRAGGKLTYVQGAARIDIAGLPRQDGKEWANGQWRPIVSAAAPVPMQVVQNPGTGNEATNTTLQVLQTLLPMMQGGDLGGVDLPGLITAISGVSSQRQSERDSFRDMERAFSLLNNLRESNLGGGGEQAPAASSWEQMMPMMMMKMMSGDQPRPNQVPPGAYPGLPPGMPMPGAQPTGAYPHAPPYPQHPQAHQYPHGYPPPQSAPPPAHWTPPPQPGQPMDPAAHSPAEARAAPSPEAAGPSRPAAPDLNDDQADDEPYSPDHVMAELEEMSPDDRAKFLVELGERLGLPDAMMAMVPGAGGNGSPAGPPVSAVPPYTVELPTSEGKK
jgi:hypothetical protein